MYTLKSDNKDFKNIIGNINCFEEGKVFPIFDTLVKSFFSELSKKLFKIQNINNFPDLVTFAFFCRRSSLSKLSKEYEENQIRIGWGNTLHITPSNVPINTAYSFLFSLLAGNVSLIKVPSQYFPQLEILFDAIKDTFEEIRYESISNSVCFIQCSHESSFLNEALYNCDCRIIWGGDNTVKQIRSKPSKPSSIELAFPDRSSICILDLNKVEKLDDDDLQKLCDDFYNDTLLIDQNACSSPSIVLWFGKKLKKNKKIITRFWTGVQKSEIRNGPLGVKKYIDKTVSLAKLIQKNINQEISIQEFGLGTTICIDNQHDVINTDGFSLGMYKQYNINDLDFIRKFISKKTQTISYYGVNPNLIADKVLIYGIRGVDRIVPVGDALNMGLIWDGKDLVRSLSRIIKIN